MAKKLIKNGRLPHFNINRIKLSLYIQTDAVVLLGLLLRDLAADDVRVNVEATECMLISALHYRTSSNIYYYALIMFVFTNEHLKNPVIRMMQGLETELGNLLPVVDAFRINQYQTYL